jgi:hypothetical protein
MAVITVSGVFRAAAVTMIVAGVIDPAWTVTGSAPVPVEVRAARNPAGPEALAAVQRVRGRLAAAFGERVSTDVTTKPAAIVIVGRSISLRQLPRRNNDVGVVSSVAPADPPSSVRIVSAASPPPVPVGWTATIAATVEARGLEGTTSRISLEQSGAEIVGVDHRWTADVERFEARLPYTPVVEGSSLLTMRADSTRVDLRIAGSGRRLKVLMHELRPSWAVAFVRRALEADPVFDVSSFVQASRGLGVRAGVPPPAITSDALNAFDTVVIGGPEDLRPPEVEALRTFARRRGGTVVLLPDRRPFGPYVSLLPVKRFDELLVDNSLELRVPGGTPIRASEFAIPAGSHQGADELAVIIQGTTTKPAILTWPLGAGSVLFSGALDAWRYRASAGDAFGRFWRARIGEAATAAPARVEVSVTPPVAGPGDEVVLTVRLRPTELVETRAGIRAPAIRVRVVGAGAERLVRVWPALEDGSFEGTLKAPAAGVYDVQVTTDAGAAGDGLLTVLADARHPDVASNDGRESLQIAAAATGGVAVEERDLSPLERHLATLPRAAIEERMSPTRSPWFAAITIALLSAEWALRRRRGLL